MHKALTAVVSALALAVPTVDAWAAVAAPATTAKKKVVTATKTFSGASEQADRWGRSQVADQR